MILDWLLIPYTCCNLRQVNPLNLLFQTFAKQSGIFLNFAQFNGAIVSIDCLINLAFFLQSIPQLLVNLPNIRFQFNSFFITSDRLIQLTPTVQNIPQTLISLSQIGI